MESVAPPGGVMLSESTAGLVENDFALGAQEFVRIKGSDDSVRARRLLSVSTERRPSRRHSRLVGRESETAAISKVLDKSLNGAGTVVTVAGPPGIGKTRLVRESVLDATSRGFKVFSTYCESHTREISFHVISRLLRAVFGIGGLTPEAARMRVRSRSPPWRMPRTCCCSMSCWASAIPICRCPTSARTPGGVGSSSSSNQFRWLGRTRPYMSSRTHIG